MWTLVMVHGEALQSSAGIGSSVLNSDRAPHLLKLKKFKRKFNKGHAFRSKCVSLVKEQRARLYILRRCATMLCCWYIHGDE
ncbi:hypothetical protein Bca101_062727 [Brassica carinata]